MNCQHCGKEVTLKKTLTVKQKQYLEYITNYWMIHDISPTLDEIRIFMGLSAVSSVHEKVMELQKKGYIKKEFGASRGIILL